MILTLRICNDEQFYLFWALVYIRSYNIGSYRHISAVDNVPNDIDKTLLKWCFQVSSPMRNNAEDNRIATARGSIYCPWWYQLSFEIKLIHLSQWVCRWTGSWVFNRKISSSQSFECTNTEHPFSCFLFRLFKNSQMKPRYGQALEFFQPLAQIMQIWPLTLTLSWRR